MELALPSSEEVVPPTPPLPSMVQKNVVPPRSSKVASPTPTCTPWLLTSLILVGLNAYFPQLSLVSFLWSPLQAAILVAHWMASWWFVAQGWEPNLVSLSPLSLTITVLGLANQVVPHTGSWRPLATALNYLVCIAPIVYMDFQAWPASPVGVQPDSSMGCDKGSLY
ncbi:hypothetical protein DSO57_1014022 [Entomophthora muscae]|uniref:Uncharacterized protein n=1 Tax=Entomophthora muscae TaxID=34485 RepID=A0ACC2T5P9_9FUNG|nr:hypothetical protein DSO57_1014022 [Entomophthora muscae]